MFIIIYIIGIINLLDKQLFLSYWILDVSFISVIQFRRRTTLLWCYTPFPKLLLSLLREGLKEPHTNLSFCPTSADPPFSLLNLGPFIRLHILNVWKCSSWVKRCDVWKASYFLLNPEMLMWIVTMINLRIWEFQGGVIILKISFLCHFMFQSI